MWRITVKPRLIKYAYAVIVVAAVAAAFGLSQVNSSDADMATQDQDPIGAIQLYMGSSDPGNGWVIANGRALSRSSYSALFSATGVIYGSGDGSSTFNIPDLQGRKLIGADTVAGSSGRITSRPAPAKPEFLA